MDFTMQNATLEDLNELSLLMNQGAPLSYVPINESGT